MPKFGENKIPYYGTDGRLLDVLSPKRAERYVSDLTARAVLRAGRIVKVILRRGNRAYSGSQMGIAALHSGSRATERARADQTCQHHENGQLLSPGLLWEHDRILGDTASRGGGN